jgi:hypothetical protein
MGAMFGIAYFGPLASAAIGDRAADVALGVGPF